MALATLTIDLVGKLASFERDLGLATRLVQRQAVQMESAFSKVGTALSTVGIGVSLGAVVVKLEAMGKAAIDSLDALVNLRTTTGSTIENLSALEDVAARSGNSFEVVTAAAVKFNMVLKDAKPGSDAEAAFKAINLSVRELQDLDPAEALRRVAVALAGFADDGNKSRLSMELFGRKLPEISDFLRDLGQQGELVAKVTTEQAEAAKKFNDELSSMSKNILDLTRTIVGPLVSGFNTLIAKFREGQKAGEGWFAFNRRMLAEGVGAYMPALSGADLGGAGLATFAGANDQSAAESARLARRRSVGVLPFAADKAKHTAEAQGTRTATSELSKYADTLEKAARRAADLSAVEEARLVIAENLNRQSSTALQADIMRYAALIDEAKTYKDLQADLLRQAAELDRGMIAGEDAAQRRTDTLRAELRDLSGRTGADKKRELTAQLEADLASNTFLFTPEELDRTVRGIAGVNDEVKKTTNLAEELGLTFASAFENAVIGGKSFSQVLKGLLADIERVVLRKAVTEPLSNFVVSALTSFLPKFASGTDYVPRDMLAMVHRGERIIPASQNASGGGVVNNYFTVGDVASVSMVQRAIAASERNMVSAARRSQRYGGATA